MRHARVPIYAKVQQMLKDDAGFIFLFQNDAVFAMNKKDCLRAARRRDAVALPDAVDVMQLAPPAERVAKPP